MNIPTQTSQNARRQGGGSSLGLSKKIGVEKLGVAKQQQLLRNFYGRKVVLRIPELIKANNPDKHFKWVNFNRLKDSGMFHKDGYLLYKVDTKNEEALKHDGLDASRFDAQWDGLVHRNEMVLAYIPQEEYEDRLLEKQLVNTQRDLTQIITGNDDLRGFNATSQETVTTQSMREVLADGEKVKGGNYGE